jgi:hypothetical protein
MPADYPWHARRGRIAPFEFLMFSVIALCGATAYMRGGSFFTSSAPVASPDPQWSASPADFQQPEGHQRMLTELVKYHERELELNWLLGEGKLSVLRDRV